MKKLFSYLLCCFAVSISLPVSANMEDCDPVIKLGKQVTTLQQALSVLAKQHDFELNFPVNADHAIESVDGMRLSQALKYLTSGMNTVLQHEKVAGCADAKLLSMEVLPVGEKGEYIHVKPQASIQVEPVYIDDMERYAEEVLLKQRKLDKGLTPEQQQEYKDVRQEVKKRLKAEGLLKSKNNKNEKQKDNKKREAEPQKAL